LAKTPNIAEIREYLQKAQLVEKYVMFPVKAVIIGACFAMLWGVVAKSKEFGLFRWSLIFFTVGNIIYWFLLLLPSKRLSNWKFFRTIIFLVVIMDNMFLAYMIYLGSVSGSSPFWIYGGLIIRNTLLFPGLRAFSILNVSFFLLYTGAVVLANMIGANAEHIEIQTHILRITVLVFFSTSCWGLYHIYERRRKMIDQNQEKSIRMGKLELAGRVAGEIAHELKNPLAIMNNAIYILGKYNVIADDKAKKQIGIIDHEIKRSDKIITELVDYARLADSKIEDANVNGVIMDTVSELKQNIIEKQIKIETRLRDDLPTLFIDKTQLKQVCANLILNACEAVNDGGKIYITTLYGHDDAIQISIEDNGKGMAEKEKARIFEPFFTTKEGGTGLGLSIVNNIVQAYGGKIVVETRKEIGTRFLVKFPVRIGKTRGKKG